MRRFVLVLLVALASSAAAAQICVPELRDALTDLSTDRPATGIDAALVVERAVRLVEPALPRMVVVNAVPVAKGAPHYADVLYLAERRLLPAGWKPGAIDAATWQAMLDRFQSWYKVKPFQVHAPQRVSDLLLDGATALDRVSKAIRPAALLASDPSDPTRIAFWAIIWNWTVYPRLIVLHPRNDVTLTDGPKPVLARMGDCAVHISSYVMAPAQDAAQLFLATNKSRMYVVGGVPAGTASWPKEVAAGQELKTFTFQTSLVEKLDTYAAVFDGPDVGFRTVLGLLPKLRTNMSPTRFLSYMKTP
jgi:hypothetical protein